MSHTTSAATPKSGLTEQEVLARRAAGQGNDMPRQSSRTYGDILRHNLFTFINVILFFLSLVLIALGRVEDVGVIVFVIGTNIVVNIYQEIRAKIELDRIAVVSRPKVTTIREGQEKVIDPNEIVVGDLFVVRPGEQIVVDGTVVGDGRVNMDESLLTGESDVIPKQAGDPLYSGSFCVSGQAKYQAEKVGKDSYANQLTSGAKSFRRIRTPLQREIDLIVRVLLVAAIFLWLLAGISLLMGLTSFEQSVENAAVIAGLVPSGLFLMSTLAYAIGSVRMAERNALIQQPNAIESLSHINVMCLDKTGTITANRIQLQSLQSVGLSENELRSRLGDFAASASSSNKTNDAIAQACPGQKRKLKEEIAFASAYKWSAEAFEQGGIYVLGAPDVLSAVVPLNDELHQAIQAGTDRGGRVLLFAHTSNTSNPTSMRGTDPNHPQLPSGLQAIGLLFFADELRPHVQQTLDRFQAGGIEVKVISGDDPNTVAAIATQAGLGFNLKRISGQDLAKMNDSEFAQAATDITVFGRITPDQKARLVKALQSKGKYVAMTGDGVNDVPSLKQANVGIAMESGSPVTRGVADIILLKDSFEALPDAFLEGQRIRNSIQDVTKIALVRGTAFFILMLSLVMPGIIFPITIKHNAILTLLTEGIPTLGVTLWATPGKPSKQGLLRSIVPFILPAMSLLALFSLLVYIGYTVRQITSLADLLDGDIPLREINKIITPERIAKALFRARNSLLTFLIFCGLLLILLIKPPTRFWTGGAPLSGDWRYPLLAIAMLSSFIGLLVVPGLRSLFDLTSLQAIDYLVLALLAFIWALVVRTAWRNHWLENFVRIESVSK